MTVKSCIIDADNPPKNGVSGINQEPERYNKKQAITARNIRRLNGVLLFTIKIERSGGEGGRSTELHQALNGVTVTDQGGGTRLVSWRDCETGEEREVTVSRRGQTEQGEVPARVVYIENAAGNTTQIVRPRATQL